MDRYQELVDKGWANLNGDERKEYQDLKPDAKPVETFAPKTPEPVKDTIEIPKEEYAGILSRLRDLEEGKKARQGGLHDSKWQKIEEKSGIKTATLRFLDDNYAVDLWHYKTEFNERTREKDMIYMIKWLLPSGEFEEKEMKLVDFVGTVPRQEVKLIDKKVEKLKQVVERTRRIEVDYAKYKSIPKEDVDMTVTMDKVVFTVELPDGRKIELDSDKLNG